MRTFLLVLLCVITFATSSHAYQKWEEMASSPKAVLYLDEESISQKSETEYVVTLRWEYKNPTTIDVTQPYYKKGEARVKKTKQKVKSEIDTALIDLSRGKMYLQSAYYLSDAGNINITVTPSDVVESGSAVYDNVAAAVRAKYNLSAPAPEPSAENALSKGVRKFFDISKSDGMIGATGYVEDCYDQSKKNRDMDYFAECAAVDVAASTWDAFVSKENHFPPTDYFEISKVRGRIARVLVDTFHTSAGEKEQVINGMLLAIGEKYQEVVTEMANAQGDPEEPAEADDTGAGNGADAAADTPS